MEGCSGGGGGLDWNVGGGWTVVYAGLADMGSDLRRSSYVS